jgi:EF hand domain-containing protein
MALTLFGVTLAVPSALAATSRSKQRTPAKRTVVAKSQKRGAAKTTKAPAQKKRAVTKEPSIHIQGHENVFRALDRNSSGFISRDEWPGSKMAFDAVDKNSDGRISLDELRAKED